MVLDACVEPFNDPVSANLPCAVPGGGPEGPYVPSGVDMRLLVATGFPGLALGASAYDRLRGVGRAQAAIASSTVRLHLPDLADDGTDATGLAAGVAMLGGGGRSALALVSHELYFGACGELARSRRQRRFPPNAVSTDNPRFAEIGCLVNRRVAPNDPIVRGCNDSAGPTDACDDDNPQNAPTAAVIELTRELPTYLLEDTSPLLQGINADVRPTNATIDGIIGTEVLSRLVSTIDYPNDRFIARCASNDGCLTYPRYKEGGEGTLICTKQSEIPISGGGLCSAAPPRP